MTHEIHSLEDVRPIIVTTRIIVVALAAGIAFFAAFALVFRGVDLQADWGVMTMLAIVVGCSNAPLSFLVANLFSSIQVQQIIDGNQTSQDRGHRHTTTIPADQLQRLAQVFQSKTIIACALLEGAAFFALVALLVEGHPANLVLAAVMLALILTRFPSIDGFSQWVEQRRQHIEHLQQLAVGTKSEPDRHR